ncbi:MAG: iron ABC transporter permease [Eubacteriales bacterium]|nr:iron ABC transporter permease [Eubacteriales bacterium]
MNRGQARAAGRKIAVTAVFLAALLGLFFLSVNLGSLKVSFGELFRGLFIEADEQVQTIYDLRFPRILISMLAGAGLAVSGALLQAVLKNPLADPGIIGVCSGAQLATVLVAALLPGLYGAAPLFSFLGGLLAFWMVYLFSRKNGFSSLRLILVGIAVQALFSGLSNALNSFSGGNISTVTSIVEGNITMKTWSDVNTLCWFVIPGLLAALLLGRWCNLLGLEDKTVRGLGMNVSRMQLIISLVSVLLASSCTAIVGVVGFLALLVPHIGRLLVGSDHRYLLPFSAILGALIYLAADTAGRTIAYPYEISAAILMSVIGGPVFILLLQRSTITHGK